MLLQTNVQVLTGYAGPASQHVVTPPHGLNANAGRVFWMFEVPVIGNPRWIRRVVWTLNGIVVQIDAGAVVP
jgi:hypothetical protein